MDFLFDRHISCSLFMPISFETVHTCIYPYTTIPSEDLYSFTLPNEPVSDSTSLTAYNDMRDDEESKNLSEYLDT